jgi:hypothetical protein
LGLALSDDSASPVCSALSSDSSAGNIMPSPFSRA